ncbi:MAG: Lrp/AsnC family transcriptional regulator [Desulfurococcaceae archaeon]
MIDNLDRKILNELIRNARISYRELAKLVNLTDVAVIKRVKRLENQRIIKKYTTIVNPATLGYNVISYTGINVAPEKLFNVIKALKEKEYIKYMAITSGDHDIFVVIWASSTSELEKIHEEIRNLDGVIAVYPMILSEIIKDDIYI